MIASYLNPYILKMILNSQDSVICASFKESFPFSTLEKVLAEPNYKYVAATNISNSPVILEFK